MPPRFAYWTILIDNAPTAFRAREAAELLPTLNQLKRTNDDVVMKWFARGRLWESKEQEHADFQQRRFAARPPRERRTREWRPGGEHKDPRARFDKEKRRRDKRAHRAERERTRDSGPGTDTRPSGSQTKQADRPWKPEGQRPWKPKGQRPWKPKGQRPGPRRWDKNTDRKKRGDE